MLVRNFDVFLLNFHFEGYDISHKILGENLQEQRIKFAEFRSHYFCTEKIRRERGKGMCLFEGDTYFEFWVIGGALIRRGCLFEGGAYARIIIITVCVHAPSVSV